MSLLRKIQSDLVGGEAPLGPIMLKLRLLAARLGSPELGDWVKHESEGYPSEMEVPEYRKLGVSFVAHFSGPFGSGISKAPIPPVTIAQFAGDEWNTYKLGQGVAAIDDLIATAKSSKGFLKLNYANLIFALQGNVYEGYACNSVEGTISAASLSEVQHTVRSRVLELLIELEAKILGSVDVKLDGPPADVGAGSKEEVRQIYQTIIHGNAGSVSAVNSGVQSTGDHNRVDFSPGDQAGLIKYLEDGGVLEPAASDAAQAIIEDTPGDITEPLGKKAKAWLSDNLRKAADGALGVGVTVLTNVLSRAAIRYYGLE